MMDGVMRYLSLFSGIEVKGKIDLFAQEDV